MLFTFHPGGRTINSDISGKTGYLSLALALLLIIASGVAWRVASTASEVVGSPTSYPARSGWDSLAPYLRPMTLTSSRTDVGTMDVLTGSDYYAAPGARAPSFGGPPPRSTRPRWVVSAILLTDTRRMAVVNDSVVVLGSMVPGGARVVAIESDHVVLQESGGARRVISLNR